MLTIDGAMGEGGGQVLRTALGLSLATGTPFRIEGIRAGRKKPGLLRQHLTCVRAATEIGGAEVVGDELGSKVLEFRPSGVFPGDYTFSVGTAGSTGLVLQTVLPALITGDSASTLRLRGGTHNPAAPPFDFLAGAFLPLLGRTGARVEMQLLRPGFFPAGGGEVVARVEPCASLEPFELRERGEIVRTSARSLVARLSPSIAERELRAAARRLTLEEKDCRVDVVRDAPGPGNAILVTVESENVTEVFTGFGAREKRAEVVARQATDDVREYLAARVPVGEHLADQLLIPLALAGGGAFRTVRPSLHTRTNAEVVGLFLPVEFDLEELPDGRAYDVTVRRTR